MKILIKFFLIPAVIFLFPVISLCQNEQQEEQPVQQQVQLQQKSSLEKYILKVIDRENYTVQIKRYGQRYPIVLYVIFKDSTPLLDEISKIIKTEMLYYVNTENVKDTIIGSARFDDRVSDNLEKIELTKNYGAFVFMHDAKGGQIIKFPDYLKYLKKKKLKS